jgi:osmotically-inducible protein OsmY
MKIGTLVVGGAIGAALAYYLDPVAGRGRRIRLRDQAMSKVRTARDRADAQRRYTTNAARGRMSERLSPGPDNREPDDRTLADRIRSEVFGAPDIADDRIALTVVEGVAELRGELDATQDVALLADRVSAVPGVRGVVNMMHVHGTPAPNKEDALRASEAAERRTS